MNPGLRLAYTWLCTLIAASSILQAYGDTIFCRCNTWDCAEKNQVLCSTNFQCYVQVTHYEDPDQDPDILYGCLDQTSILCQNPRPQNYDGIWPIVQCCSHDSCNKDIVPTEPPEWPKMRPATTPQSSSQSSSYHPQDDLSHTQHSTSSSSSNTFSINPFYIAFPIAGAVILVILIVFAVYILRHQPRSARSDYKYHSAPLNNGSGKHPPPPLASSSLHHHNGLTAPASQQRQHHNGHNSHHNGLLIVPPLETDRGPKIMAVEPFCNSHPPGRPYPDGERSSSGSESKLLMRV